MKLIWKHRNSFYICNRLQQLSGVLKGFGEILKRPTRADCKSADYVFVGSNPTLPTKTLQAIAAFFFMDIMDQESIFLQFQILLTIYQVLKLGIRQKVDNINK